MGAGAVTNQERVYAHEEESLTERAYRILEEQIVTLHLPPGTLVSETMLTTSNVNTAAFGKLFTDPIDAQVYAEPLYVANVIIPNQGTHNVRSSIALASGHPCIYMTNLKGTQESRQLTRYQKSTPGNPTHTTTNHGSGSSLRRSSASAGIWIRGVRNLVTGAPCRGCGASRSRGSRMASGPW